MTPTFITKAQKIERSEQLVRESYYKKSVLDQLVNVRDANHGDQNFLKLGRRIYIPEEWYSRDDIYYDLALSQLGENIAFSEKKFIIEEILKDDRISRTSLPEINLANLKEQLRCIVETIFRPTLLFAPIEYFTKLFNEWVKQDTTIRVVTFDRIIISGHPYDIFWSNRYIPFKAFIVADRSYGEWVAKPTFNDRLYVKISESDKADKMDLQLYTTFKFSIVNTSRIAILQ